MIRLDKECLIKLGHLERTRQSRSWEVQVIRTNRTMTECNYFHSKELGDVYAANIKYNALHATR